MFERIRHNGWYLALTTVTIAAATGLSWHFFSLPLDPWPDQAATLQAAIRLSNGLGLTTVGLGTDITQPAVVWLINWPPGYPLIVAALLKAGMDVETAVKSINAGALLLGTAGWIGLAMRYLSRKSVLAIFCGLIVVSCGALVPKGGTMDYLLWAAIPYWMRLMLSLRELGPQRAVLPLVILASVVVAAMIGIRWAAAVFVPSGCLILFWGHWNSRDWRRQLSPIVVFAVPPTLLFMFLGWFNRKQSGIGATVLSYVEPRWQLEKLLTAYPLENLTTIPIGLEPLLKRIWRFVDPVQSEMALGLLLGVIVPAMLVSTCIWYRARSRREHPWGPLDIVIVTTLLLQVGLLAFLSARYNWTSLNWSYLEEPRYFRPFLPAIALWWLVLLERLGTAFNRVRIGLSLLLAVAIGYLLQAHIRWEFEYLTKPDPTIGLVSKVLELSSVKNKSIVFDVDSSKYVSSDRAGMLVYAYPDPLQTQRLTASRPVDIWIVRRPKERAPYQIDPDFNQKRFSALQARFDAVIAWSSPDGDFEIYHARLSGN